MNKNITLGELLSFIVISLAFIGFTIGAFIYGGAGAGSFMTIISLAIIVVGLDQVFTEPIKSRTRADKPDTKTDREIRLPIFND